MGTQSLTGHQTVNMKVVLALACVVAGASAYPMFFLEEADPIEYVPVHRVARQAPIREDPRPFQNRRQGVEDSIPAADTPYGHAPVVRVKIQVYRGPSKGDYDFAPWGYYNTQPADLANHHYLHGVLPPHLETLSCLQ